MGLPGFPRALEKVFFLRPFILNKKLRNHGATPFLRLLQLHGSRKTSQGFLRILPAVPVVCVEVVLAGEALTIDYASELPISKDSTVHRGRVNLSGPLCLGNFEEA